jgi:phenylalanyl-tRNA synthetase beta chain
MNISLRWLREYVDLTLPVAALIEKITMAGLEVGGVRLIGEAPPEGMKLKQVEAGPVWHRDKIVIAQVMEVKKHPDADRLTLVTLNYGKPEPKVVVTGATNIKVGDSGQKVVLALTGSVLYDGHAEGKVLKELKPSKIRGVPSDAMVCSVKELGIAEEHEGIILLPADAPVGMPLVDYLGDIVLEVDILPNMARCLGMIGVAREVAALTGQKLKLPSTQVQTAGEPITGKVQVQIADPNLCRRFTATLIQGVKIGPSPLWMQQRLQAAGMRPISNMVDVTNYVMMEWGQPVHAFDYDKLVARAGGQPPTIMVRPARPGETLTTLDGQKRELTPQNLLIADTVGPIGLAGVMGGAETELSDTTRNILLEVANFDFVSVRKTARQFDLHSEASYRFSRSLHPEMVQPVAQRTAELFRQLGGGTVAPGMVDVYPTRLPVQEIKLPLSEVKRLLGIDIPLSEIVRILRSLEYTVTEVPGGQALQVVAPPHRTDIQEGAADLIEDIARIYGYDRLPATLLAERLPRQENNRSLLLEERTKDILVKLGLTEVRTYALTVPEKEKPLGLPERPYITLANPISSERVVLRHSVLASVLEVALWNLKENRTKGLRLFEVGYAYLPQEGQQFPAEPARLAIVMAGARTTEHWDTLAAPAKMDFFDLKGVMDALAKELHLPNVSYQPAKVPYLHPGQSAELRSGDKLLGTFGRLNPALNEPYRHLSKLNEAFKEIGKWEILAGEFDLETLLAQVPELYRFTPVPEMPPVLQDIALVVDEALPAAKVEKEIWAGGGDLLRAVRLFDVYRGPNLPPGKKSLAYALTYQAADRTLTDKEVAKVHGKIVSRMEKVLGAALRA